MTDEGLAAEITQHYPDLGRVEVLATHASVHDVVEIAATGERYALKLYRPGTRAEETIRWEASLHRHLKAFGAPVTALIPGGSGDLETLIMDEVPRTAVLTEWAAGRKPAPGAHTYRLLGRAAARIHAAADHFDTTWPVRIRDVDTEVHEELSRMRPLLEVVGQWEHAAALGEGLGRYLGSSGLERGICHSDLTLDNVHVDGDRLTVFDFDSAGEHWRAAEPQSVFHYGVTTGEPWWQQWLAGYRVVRALAAADEEAVPYFALLCQFENVAWKLGLTSTSRRASLGAADLPAIVAGWREWAAVHCPDL